MSAGVRLTRDAFAERTGAGASPPPVRIVHLGLGAFHRSHQAWYTAAADPRGEWGIAAFTGRSPEAAQLLDSQGGLYCLLVRSSTADTVTVLPSISEAWDGARVDRLSELLASTETAIVTVTITESGYRLLSDGSVDWSDPVVVDDARILSERASTPNDGSRPTSVLARLVWGLAQRRDNGAGPLAVVPCDNMPRNGVLVARAVAELAAMIDESLPDWIASTVSFVSTSVDRITPKTTDADRRVVEDLSGWIDATPVVAEPFSDWVLSGEFPAGRPAWELGGARFVDDIEPFERRKLWLLNGAHSLLAYAGLARGHRTVAEAIGDPECRGWVEELWAEASRHLPDHLGLNDYCSALIERFSNHRIQHELAQVALESVNKLRFRIVPVARAERSAGRGADACSVAIGAWVSMMRREAAPGSVVSAEIARALAAPEHDVVGALVSVLDDGLGADSLFVSSVARVCASFDSEPALP